VIALAVMAGCAVTCAPASAQVCPGIGDRGLWRAGLRAHLICCSESHLARAARRALTESWAKLPEFAAQTRLTDTLRLYGVRLRDFVS